jgi:malonyl-CoA/methylmalonyl-CoA synthetase
LVRDFAVTHGDRVAVQLGKVPEVLALNVACARIGAIYVPLNSGYTDREVSDLLDDVTPTVLVRSGKEVHGTPQVGLDELLRSASRFAPIFTDATCDADTPAAMLFTSGTTGRPKGAVLSHGNLSFGCLTLNDVWKITSDDVLVHVLPLYHVHGLYVAAYCSLSSGATMKFIDQFDVGDVLETFPESTVMMGVPTHYTRLLADVRLSRESTRTMRLFVSGSAPMLRSTHEEFLRRTGHQILERYGMTETGMITSNPLIGVRKPGMVGPALPGIEVRVNGVPGGVEVRGPNVLLEYWNRPELRDSEFTADGFFKTGDIGVFDEDGYLEIVGRSKDIIITGGLNVYPKEVELVIDGFPGVLESAVVGLPDHDFGELVIAVVVASSNEQLNETTLLGLAKQSLASFKIPKHFIIVDELPRNSMGKVQKALLRNEMAGLNGSKDGEVDEGPSA